MNSGTCDDAYTEEYIQSTAGTMYTGGCEKTMLQLTLIDIV